MTQTIINLGTGGAALNGQNGSTAGADSNDALFLDWPGDNAGNYVYLPGRSGDFMQVPDEAALDITGDLDLRAEVALDNWTPSVTHPLVAKFGTAGNRSYRLDVDTNGRLNLVLMMVLGVTRSSFSLPMMVQRGFSWGRQGLAVRQLAFSPQLSRYRLGEMLFLWPNFFLARYTALKFLTVSAARRCLTLTRPLLPPVTPPRLVL
jgi:hypothetical protein